MHTAQGFGYFVSPEKKKKKEKNRGKQLDLFHTRIIIVTRERCPREKQFIRKSVLQQNCPPGKTKKAYNKKRLRPGKEKQHKGIYLFFFLEELV